MAYGISAEDSDRVKELRKRFESAKSLRDMVVSMMDDAYKYVLPSRSTFFDGSASTRREARLFDSTAVVAAQSFASRLQSGVTPTFSKWMTLQLGKAVKVSNSDRFKIDSRLAVIADQLFEVINSSGFETAASEIYQDLAVGTAALLIQKGDIFEPISFVAVPMTEIILERGPDGRIGGVYWMRCVKYGHIPYLWPDAVIGEDLQAKIDNSKNDECTVIEATLRDYSVKGQETHNYTVFMTEPEMILKSGVFRGFGSNPWVTPRWNVPSGELYGRGPAIMALADIKTLNLTVEMVLENADIAIGGLWQTDDDGTINPYTIELVGGTVIPKMPGTEGLKPLEAPSRFDVSQMIIEDLRKNIKNAFYDEEYGPGGETPASAFEVQRRVAALSRRVGAPFGRLHNEFAVKVVHRCLHILKDMNMIDIPEINGKDITVVNISPYAIARYSDEVMASDRFIEMLTARFGPEAALTQIGLDRYSEFIAESLGVPKKVLATTEERAAFQELVAKFVGQMMAQQQQGAA